MQVNEEISNRGLERYLIVCRFPLLEAGLPCLKVLEVANPEMFQASASAHRHPIFDNICYLGHVEFRALGLRSLNT